MKKGIYFTDGHFFCDRKELSGLLAHLAREGVKVNAPKVACETSSVARMAVETQQRLSDAEAAEILKRLG